MSGRLPHFGSKADKTVRRFDVDRVEQIRFCTSRDGTRIAYAI